MNIKRLKQKSELDVLVLDIEFLIISVVQGVALAALASFAVPIFAAFKIEYFPYIFSGFLFILLFWSGAIIHALSFIDWPLDLPHNFLYFLASFIEVVAFGQMSNPKMWFLMVTIFFMVAEILYFVDLGLIKKRQKAFDTTISKKLYKHIIERHLFEMKVLVPAGTLFNFIGLVLIVSYEQIFLTYNWHILLISLQLLFSLGLMFNSIWSFNSRSKLITANLSN
ncbi:hypothetical protein HY384_03405 [Candidatus Daviesbacteria bacterium]|nr:hypothetical protein [Candidatus Daviesbacteria bacterium]